MKFKLKVVSIALTVSLLLTAVANAANAAQEYLVITDPHGSSVVTNLTLGDSSDLALRNYNNPQNILANTSFSSSDPNVAIVDSQGRLTAKNLGSTVITATYSGQSVTKSFEISLPMSLQFDQSQYVLSVGELKSFSYSGTNSRTQANVDMKSRFTFKSSNTSVIRIDNGYLVGVGEGSATIQASINGMVYTSISAIVNKNGSGIPYPTVPTRDPANMLPDPLVGLEDTLPGQRSSAMSYMNNLRSAMGLNTLTENPLITKAAQYHANYLFNLPPSVSAYSRAHGEVSGESGFTGDSPSARLSYVGYSSRGYGEVIHYIDNVDNRGIKGLIDAPFHRVIILGAAAVEAGVGVRSNKKGFTVVDFGVDMSTPEAKKVVYYPYPGQTDVQISWLALETPNPMTPHGKEGEVVGYPITISMSGYSQTFVSATIKDSSGNTVDYYRSDSSNLGSYVPIILTPKVPLKPSTTYTVDFSGQSDSGAIQKTWSFTTADDALSGITSSMQSLALKVGESSAITITARSETGVKTDVTSSTTFSSSAPNVEISNGVITATSLPTGKVTVTASYQGKSTTINVNVLTVDGLSNPKSPTTPSGSQTSNTVGGTGNLKSTIINFSPSELEAVTKVLQTLTDKDGKPFTLSKLAEMVNRMGDVRNHWAAPEIAWAIEYKVTEGYEDNTFRPNGNVTEAEFITFMLRSLKFDSFGAWENKNELWSDEWYGIARKYNVPLSGYYDLSARDEKINRNRVAEIISAMDGQSLSGDKAVKYLLDKGYSEGKTATTVEGYSGSDNITRAEVIKFILNLKNKGVKEVKWIPET